MPPVFFGFAQFIIFAASFLSIFGADLSAACTMKSGRPRDFASLRARMCIHRETVSQ